MQIPKDKIVELLKERGEYDKAAQAEQELPDNIDHEEHAAMLKKHGINTQDLLGKIGLQPVTRPRSRDGLRVGVR